MMNRIVPRPEVFADRTVMLSCRSPFWGNRKAERGLFLVASLLLLAPLATQASAGDAPPKKLEGILLATATKSTPTHPAGLAPPPAPNLSVAGEITTPGTIVSAGKLLDLGPYDQNFAGLQAANAVLETPGGMQITVTCLTDVRPCAPEVRGRWTLRPAFDPVREVVRWTVSRFTPSTAGLWSTLAFPNPGTTTPDSVYDGFLGNPPARHRIADAPLCTGCQRVFLDHDLDGWGGSEQIVWHPGMTPPFAGSGFAENGGDCDDHDGRVQQLRSDLTIDANLDGIPDLAGAPTVTKCVSFPRFDLVPEWKSHSFDKQGTPYLIVLQIPDNH
jgi:hypothetical protein